MDRDDVADSPVLSRVRELVLPIASDLGLELYDVEQRGGTMRVTLDTPPGSPGGITLDELALASRLVSRELDHHDPVPGHYTLEVTSPGVERALRTPAHFRREIGKVVAIRLSDVGHDDRRITGTLVAADDTSATVAVDGPDGPTERTVGYDQIDRARTVFEWGTAAKPVPKRRKKEKSTHR
jgi:ribosome maturation factor RimP